MKNILMIATGGTIASKEGDLGLTPAVTGEELAASVPGIKDICQQLRWVCRSSRNRHHGIYCCRPVLSDPGQCKANRTDRFPETNGQSLYRCKDQSVPEYSVCCRRSFLQCLHCI